MPPPAPRPFLRWVGGKRRLIPALLAALPRRLGTYFEPFLGGGALLFSLPAVGARKVNDLNADLVTSYQVLRDYPDELIAALRTHAHETTETAYYRLRNTTPTDPIDVAARFITLNRLCFQGLYRENRNGRMNVPYGHLAAPTVCDERLLRADAVALTGVDITCGTYTDALADAAAGDFVYLDPPYVPISATAGFTDYIAGGFTSAHHRELAAAITDLDARGVRVMLSNSDTPQTRAFFADLHLHTVSVHRSVAAKAAARRTVTEILGVNYATSVMRNPAAFRALTTNNRFR